MDTKTKKYVITIVAALLLFGIFIFAVEGKDLINNQKKISQFQ